MKKKKKLKLSKLTVGTLSTKDIVKVKGGYYLEGGGGGGYSGYCYTSACADTDMCPITPTSPQRCAISGGN